MPTKKKVWLIIIVLAGVALACFFFSLPGITTNFLVSQAEKFGLKNLQFKTIHVGWQRLDLTDVTAGDAADPALRIPHLSVEYSLAGLWRKKIRNVRLVGVWIKIEDRGRGFQFHGMITPPPAQAQNIEMPSSSDSAWKRATCSSPGRGVPWKSPSAPPCAHRGPAIPFPPSCVRWRKRFACKARSTIISRPLKWPSRFPAFPCRP